MAANLIEVKAKLDQRQYLSGLGPHSNNMQLYANGGQLFLKYTF